MQRFVRARADAIYEDNVPGIYDRELDKFAGFLTASTRDKMFHGGEQGFPDSEFETFAYSPATPPYYYNLREED